MSDVKGFIKFSRIDAKKFDIKTRVQSWKEFYHALPVETLREQAARCMDCGVPFCQGEPNPNPSKSIGCPVENLIPDWNDLVHQNNWQKALVTLHQTNNFPEFTGKLCPAPCESSCVLGITSDPVTIRTIESSIIDRGFQEGWVKPKVAEQKSGRKVAIVGSGPAGLAAAQQLARAGHAVTVFEKNPKSGGLLRYGIPEFKMEKSILDRRLRQMSEEGVTFKTNVQVGTDLSIAELERDFDAICLTLGAEASRELQIPGRELKGIHPAMDFLRHQNLRLENPNFSEDEALSARAKYVVIIGGGDTGSDCLGTSHRQGCVGAVQLEILPTPPFERAPHTPWPLWPLKMRTSHAHEEGAERHFSVITKKFIGDGEKVTGLLLERTGDVPAGTPREFEIKADLVLLAMGFTGPVQSHLVKDLGLALDLRGNIQTDSHYQTSRKKIFAAGDARRGASLIVWAIAEGRKMAAQVNEFLK